MLYKNVGFISSFEDVASESIKNQCFQLSHCRLMPLLPETPANIRINLTLPETRVTGLHFATDSMDLHSIFCGGLQKCMKCETECVIANNVI